jgi:hypothetical protein
MVPTLLIASISTVTPATASASVVRERQCVDGLGRVRHDLHRAHGGKVLRDDRDGQQERSADCRVQTLAAGRGHQCRRAEQYPEQNGNRDQVGRPYDVSRQFERRHAEIMHADHSAADNGTTGRRAPARRTADSEAQAHAGYCHRQNQ